MPIEEARWLHFERRRGETLRGALERSLREAMASGALRQGVQLPSSRALAAQLGISRGVTSEAYEQLAAQGLLINRVKAAPVVAGVARSPHPAPPRQVVRPARIDLTPTTPDVSLFPARRWAAALLDTVRAAPVAAYDYGAPCGERELREALADHLGWTRGVVADPERIVVVSGTAQGVDVVARLLAGRDARRVAVEDPSLDTQPQRIRLSGLEAVGQPVDGDGLVVDGLDADAVLVTPAHQFPTGAVLSGVRRRALLGWARSRDALVVEDDYDAEFRYDREPVRALQGLDPDRVIHAGTVSKTLAPALRLGWLVLPHGLAEEAARIKHLLDVSSAVIDQRALARFLTGGEYNRHVRRMRVVYRRRRDALLAAVAERLPDLAVQGVAAGIHVLLRLPSGCDDRAVAAEAERDGVRVTPLSRYGISRPAGPGLVLGYGRVNEAAIDEAVRTLGRAIERASRVSRRGSGARTRPGS
jgi:GntR family transcriptional regulator/MocR family aminotransferase